MAEPQDGSTLVKDPVCGREVDTLRARAVGIFGGVTYYFCSAECKGKFKDPRRVPREEPEKALSAISRQPSAPERKMPEPEVDAPLEEVAPKKRGMLFVAVVLATIVCVVILMTLVK